MGTYHHVYAKGLLRDKFQILGSLMDKGLRYKRTVSIPGVEVQNVGIREIGHSDLVRDPDKFGLWNVYGLLEGFSSEEQTHPFVD